MCFLAEGRKNVLEGISNGLDLRYLLATSQFIKDNEEALAIVESEVLETTADVLTDLGTFTTNNDCLAVFEMPAINSSIDFSEHVLVLDGISDPGNLGTIIRTMDWFGMKQLVCSENTADFYNPKVVNATMGSYSRINVRYMDLPALLRQSPIPAYGADLDGIAMNQWKSAGPVVLVMGSESHGISPEVVPLLTGKVTIPKIGRAESLNVGIATGILCHHLCFNLS